MIELRVEFLKKCQDCQFEMSKIVYGYPSEALKDFAKDQNFVLGGCFAKDLEFLCKNCGGSWSSTFGFSSAV